MFSRFEDNEPPMTVEQLGEWLRDNLDNCYFYNVFGYKFGYVGGRFIDSNGYTHTEYSILSDLAANEIRWNEISNIVFRDEMIPHHWIEPDADHSFRSENWNSF